MEDRWGGCVVSLNCGPVLGVYQGRVSRVDQQCQSISLVQPFRNGARCTVPELTLSATDIKELKILELPPDPAIFQHTQMPLHNGTAPVAMTNGAQSASHPIARRGEREAEAVDSSSQQQQQQQPPSSRAHTDVPGSTPSKGFRRRHNSWSSSNRQALMGTTPKRNAGGRGGAAAGGGRRSGRDEDCFADDLDDLLDTEFDFEKNLALFDKAAVFQEIEMHHGGGAAQANGAAAAVRARGTPPADTQKYRHDENVLAAAAAPGEFHRIDVPQPGPKLYCTDTGMVVPSVSPALHRQLLGAAERAGLTAERRRDVLGVCATQMALSLLGGSNRMDPKNSHQRPTVVVLCGPHRRGAQGACVARHLANRDVRVVALVPRAPPGGLAEEVRLLERTTTARCVGSVAELPGAAVDLVVECLLGDPDEIAAAAGPLGRLKPPREAAAWAAATLAPLLAVDPPPPACPAAASSQDAPGEAGGGVAFAAKWSLVPGLPSSLGEGAGRVYLCDVGIPVRVFEEVGIAYHSPFGCKFVIPLHST
ncbi:unnamed protein product [Lampetra planeri]